MSLPEIKTILVNRKAVEKITGLSRSSIYAKMAENTFPKNVHIGPKSVRWVLNEIIEWVESAIKSRT